MVAGRRSERVSTWPLRLTFAACTSRDARAGGTPGANSRVPLLDSPMDSDHETGTVPLSGVWGVVPSTWPAGAHARASAKVHASSESRMSQDVGRCHVESPPRRETSQMTSSRRRIAIEKLRFRRAIYVPHIYMCRRMTAPERVRIAGEIKMIDLAAGAASQSTAIGRHVTRS